MSENGYHGHITLEDGTHVPLTAEHAAKILADSKAYEDRLAAEMPDEASALNRMFEGWYRLKQLGWREAIYCPKDGTRFDAVEAGSTGVFKCHYSGEWPSGSWWCEDGGDLWPSRPTLFRPPSQK